MDNTSIETKDYSAGLASKMNQIKDWYKHVLGLLPEYENTDFIPNQNLGIISYNIGDKQHLVHIYPDREEADPNRPSTCVYNIQNIADILARFEQVQSSGQHNGELVEPSSDTKLKLKDPYGYTLELYSSPTPVEKSDRGC